MARYEVQDSATGEVLSNHRTRQGAVDRWREWYVGIPVRIYRTYSDGRRLVVVEGTWYPSDDETEAQDPHERRVVVTDVPPARPDVDDDLRSILYDQLRQPVIIPLGETQVLDEDRSRRLITSVECWTWRILVRYTETPSQFDQQRGLAKPEDRHPMWGWSLTDDVGTSYRAVSSGAGGDGTWQDGMVRFDPAPPTDATELTVITPEGTAISVGLRTR